MAHITQGITIRVRVLPIRYEKDEGFVVKY